VYGTLVADLKFNVPIANLQLETFESGLVLGT
jgi:hypothetical protein